MGWRRMSWRSDPGVSVYWTCFRAAEDRLVKILMPGCWVDCWVDCCSARDSLHQKTVGSLQNPPSMLPMPVCDCSVPSLCWEYRNPAHCRSLGLRAAGWRSVLAAWIVLNKLVPRASAFFQSALESGTMSQTLVNLQRCCLRHQVQYLPLCSACWSSMLPPLSELKVSLARSCYL